MLVGRRAPISVTGEAGAVAAFEWRDAWGLGVMEVPLGDGSRILWLADPGTEPATLFATAVGAPLRVCGLRP